MPIFFQVVEVILRRRQVQDIDFNSSTLIAAIIATMVISYWLGTNGSYWGVLTLPKNNFTLLSSIIVPLVVTGVLYKFMELKEIPARFMQTSIALLIASAITTSLVVVTMPYPQLIGIGLMFAIVKIIVTVDIFKQAFEVSAGKALLYMIGLSLVSNVISAVILSLILVLTGNVPPQ